MRVITTRSMIFEVVKRWSAQYRDSSAGNDKLVILDELKALDLNTVSAQEVNYIIGNDSWTGGVCRECRTRGVTVVELGDPPDFESSTTWICLLCLRKAVALAEGSE